MIIDKDEDIFASVVEHYSIDKSGKESELSNKEKELKKITITKVLSYIKILKLWKLQKGNDQDL